MYSLIFIHLFIEFYCEKLKRAYVIKNSLYTKGKNNNTLTMYLKFAFSIILKVLIFVLINIKCEKS